VILSSGSEAHGSPQADPVSAAHNQETAIHVAVAQGRLDLLACLIQGVPGSTLEGLRNSQGNDPLHCVALVSVVSEENTLRMAELLLASGMGIDQPGGIAAQFCREVVGGERREHAYKKQSDSGSIL